MKYQGIERAVFLARPNRFIAHVIPENQQGIQGTDNIIGTAEDGRTIVSCHVKNTGRCRELLAAGASVYIENHTGRMGSRKQQYSLISVDKAAGSGVLKVNMDSQAPNKLAKEALEQGVIAVPGMGRLTEIRPETTKGDSRFDFYLKDEDGRECYMEVKGVTLESDGVAAFPDAPTERGVKHIEGLIHAREEGYIAAILFVIQMEGIRYLEPNDRTHPQFGEALRRAAQKGVQVLACECHVDMPEVKITGPAMVHL